MSKFAEPVGVVTGGWVAPVRPEVSFRPKGAVGRIGS